MKYEVGARVSVTQTLIDDEAVYVGRVGEVIETYDNNIGNVEKYGNAMYDVRFDDGNVLSLWATEVELVVESRQDALTRLLAEHKERKAALDETLKAINELVIGETVRHKHTGEEFVVNGVRKTLFADVTPLAQGRWFSEAQSIKSLEIVEDGEAK